MTITQVVGALLVGVPVVMLVIFGLSRLLVEISGSRYLDIIIGLISVIIGLYLLRNVR